MGRFFSLDSPLMSFLSRAADLMILNILVLFCSIGIITVGPSLTAMHYVLLKMVRKEEGYIVKPFFHSFKSNFKQATIAWLIILAFTALFIIDMRILNESGLSFSLWLRAALAAVGVVAFMSALYVFPLIARFENKLRVTFKNALLIAILNLPRTVLMIIVCALPVVLFMINLNILPVIFLLGISVPGYVCAMLYTKVFKRFEPEDEEVIDADAWTVSLDDGDALEVITLAARDDSPQDLMDFGGGEDEDGVGRRFFEGL